MVKLLRRYNILGVVSNRDLSRLPVQNSILSIVNACSVEFLDCQYLLPQSGIDTNAALSLSVNGHHYLQRMNRESHGNPLLIEAS